MFTGKSLEIQGQKEIPHSWKVSLDTIFKLFLIFSRDLCKCDSVFISQHIIFKTHLHQHPHKRYQDNNARWRYIACHSKFPLQLLLVPRQQNYFQPMKGKHEIKDVGRRVINLNSLSTKFIFEDPPTFNSFWDLPTQFLLNQR